MKTIKRCQHSVKEQLSVLLFLYSVLKVHMGGGGRWGGLGFFFSNWENRSNVMSTESNIRSSMSSCLVLLFCLCRSFGFT